MGFFEGSFLLSFFGGMLHLFPSFRLCLSFDMIVAYGFAVFVSVLLFFKVGVGGRLVASEGKAVSSVKGLSEGEIEKLYQDYARSFGDCEAPKELSAHHGEWVLVGHGKVTNGYCGRFLHFKICNRVELHSQSDLNGVSHAGEVYHTKVHQSCNNPQCPTCYLFWARREADMIAQRIEVASKRFGLPQHIIVSPPESDWGLAEFHNDKFRVKVKKLLSEVGVVGGCQIFHGFSYYSFQESIEKGVPFGWVWHPHCHVIGYILGGYGKCRFCSKTARTYRTRGGKTVTVHGSEVFCSGCDGFESCVRRSYEKNRYIIKCMDERKTVFGTAWYQLSHASIKVGSV